MLTLARVDALDSSVTGPCRIRNIAAGAIAALAPAALQKGVQLELLAGDEASVHGNPELLHVLLRNLLDNSIRHSPPETLVQVNISREPGAVCLSVSDSGPGITEQERARELERFYRPLGTLASGSGLGLSIVKRIAEVHDAALQILPAQEGKGLLVKVCFKS